MTRSQKIINALLDLPNVIYARPGVYSSNSYYVIHDGSDIKADVRLACNIAIMNCGESPAILHIYEDGFEPHWVR